MSIVIPKYRVLVADEKHPDDPEQATEYELLILNGDRLKTEREMPAFGVADPEEAPQATVTYWIFVALRRIGAASGEWPIFEPRILHYEEVKKGSDKTEPGSPGDPTQPGQSSETPSP